MLRQSRHLEESQISDETELPGTVDEPVTRIERSKAAFDAALADLAGSSRGEMLSARTAVEGSAGYVAIEHVSGALHGRQGSFVLQHTGVMARGVQQLTSAVVPESGTGALVGLAGTARQHALHRPHSSLPEAQAAKAGRFIPGLKLLGFRA
jgi:hypothetical protein